jgi:hypothetical protein
VILLVFLSHFSHLDSFVKSIFCGQHDQHGHLSLLSLLRGWKASNGQKGGQLSSRRSILAMTSFGWLRMASDGFVSGQHGQEGHLSLLSLLSAWKASKRLKGPYMSSRRSILAMASFLWLPLACLASFGPGPGPGWPAWPETIQTMANPPHTYWTAGYTPHKGRHEISA